MLVYKLQTYFKLFVFRKSLGYGQGCSANKKDVGTHRK